MGRRQKFNKLHKSPKMMRKNNNGPYKKYNKKNGMKNILKNRKKI